MKPELENLLKASDAFKQTSEGPEAERLFALYQAKLIDAARGTRISRETLDDALTRFHRRRVHANLPPGFPKKLGLD